MNLHSINPTVLAGWVRDTLPCNSVKGLSRGLILASMLVSANTGAALSDGVSKPVQLNPIVETGDVIQIGLGLIVIIAMIFGGAWLMRRFGNMPGRQANLQVLGGISLGSRERAVILRAGDKQMLVGVSPGCVSMLHVFDEPIVDLEKNPAGVSFSDRLINARKQQSSESEASG